MLARNCLLFQNGIVKHDPKDPENLNYQLNFVKLNDFLQKLTTQNYDLQCDIQTRMTERLYKEELKLREELSKRVDSLCMDLNLIKDFIYCSGNTQQTTLRKVSSTSFDGDSNGLMNTRDRIHMLHSEIELLKMTIKRNELEFFEANDLNQRLKKQEKILEKLIKRFEIYSSTDWYEPLKRDIKNVTIKISEDIEKNNQILDSKFNDITLNVTNVNNRIDGIKQSSISPLLSRMETNEKKIKEIYNNFLGESDSDTDNESEEGLEKINEETNDDHNVDENKQLEKEEKKSNPSTNENEFKKKKNTEKKRSGSILANLKSRSSGFLTERFVDIETFNKLKQNYDQLHDKYHQIIEKNYKKLKYSLFFNKIETFRQKELVKYKKITFDKLKKIVSNLRINDQQLNVYRLDLLDNIFKKCFARVNLKKNLNRWKDNIRKENLAIKKRDFIHKILKHWLLVTGKYYKDDWVVKRKISKAFNLWKIYSTKVNFLILLKKDLISLEDKQFENLEESLIVAEAFSKNLPYDILTSISLIEYKKIKENNSNNESLRNALSDTVSEIDKNLSDFKSNLRAEETIRAKFLDDRFNNNINEFNTIHKNLVKLNSYHDELKIHFTALLIEKETGLTELINYNNTKVYEDITNINSNLNEIKDTITVNNTTLLNNIDQLNANIEKNRENIEAGNLNFIGLDNYVYNELLKKVESNSSNIDVNKNNIDKIFVNIDSIETTIKTNKYIYDKFIISNDEAIHFIDEEIRWLKKVSTDGANSIIKLKNNMNKFKQETEKNFIDIIYDEGGDTSKENNLKEGNDISSLNSLTFSYYNDLCNLSNKLIKNNKHYTYISNQLVKLFKNFLNYNIIKKLLISLPNSSVIYNTGKYNTSNPYDINVYNKLLKCKELGNNLTISLGKLARRLSLRISSIVDQESLSLFFYIKLILSSTEIKLINSYNISMDSSMTNNNNKNIPSSVFLSNGINRFITKENLPNVLELRKFFIQKVEEDISNILEEEGNKYKHIIPVEKKEEQVKKPRNQNESIINLSLETSELDNRLEEKDSSKFSSQDKIIVSKVQVNNDQQKENTFEEINIIEESIKNFENEILNLYSQTDTVPISLSSLIATPTPTPIAPGSPSKMKENNLSISIPHPTNTSLTTNFTKINNFSPQLVGKHHNFLTHFYSNNNIKLEGKTLKKQFLKNFIKALEISLNSLPIISSFDGTTSNLTSTNLIPMNKYYQTKDSKNSSICITCDRPIHLVSTNTVQSMPISSSTTFYKTDRPQSAVSKSTTTINSNTLNHFTSNNFEDEKDDFDLTYESKTVENVRSQVHQNRPKSASYIINKRDDSTSFNNHSNTQPIVSFDHTQAFNSPITSSPYQLTSNNASIPSNSFLTSSKLYSTSASSSSFQNTHSIPPSVNVKNSSKFQIQLANALASPFPRDITFQNKHDEPIISPYESGLSSRRIKGFNEKN